MSTSIHALSSQLPVVKSTTVVDAPAPQKESDAPAGPVQTVRRVHDMLARGQARFANINSYDEMVLARAHIDAAHSLLEPAQRELEQRSDQQPAGVAKIAECSLNSFDKILDSFVLTFTANLKERGGIDDISIGTMLLDGHDAKAASQRALKEMLHIGFSMEACSEDTVNSIVDSDQAVSGLVKLEGQGIHSELGAFDRAMFTEYLATLLKELPARHGYPLGIVLNAGGQSFAVALRSEHQVDILLFDPHGSGIVTTKMPHILEFESAEKFVEYLSKRAHYGDGLTWECYRLNQSHASPRANGHRGPLSVGPGGAPLWTLDTSPRSGARAPSPPRRFDVLRPQAVDTDHKHPSLYAAGDDSPESPFARPRLTIPVSRDPSPTPQLGEGSSQMEILLRIQTLLESDDVLTTSRDELKTLAGQTDLPEDFLIQADDDIKAARQAVQTRISLELLD